MDMKKTIKRLVRTPARRAIMAADALRDARDWPAAIEAYERAVELNPRRAAIWVQYGHALKEGGERARAETAYRRALEIDGSKADTHLQLGHLLKISGRPKEAAEAYVTALELDRGLTQALREIQDLALRGVPIPADRLEVVMERIAAPTPPVAAKPMSASDPASIAAAIEHLRTTGLSEADLAVLDDAAACLRDVAARGHFRGDDEMTTGVTLVFDASDLIHYFRHSRLPTGIQRVQLEIIRSLVRSDPDGVQICAAFNERWIQVPTSLFLLLADLSTTGNDVQASDWRSATSRLEVALGTDRAYEFPEGAYLVNLGTSWHVDYLLRVRNAKRDHGIRFIPFVHDLIPIVAPQYVLADLTCDYVAWLLAVFDHADYFLTNSKSTRSDLIAAAKRLGHALTEEDVLVVPLDARFSAPATSGETGRNFLRAKGLHDQGFVLFVSTIEPRKNHLAAINAWAELQGEFGSRMPRLVCVGGRGWMNEEVFQRVASDSELARRVIFLHNLCDAELAACYDACLFTLLPSHYEGWGLPVTESLCHGKVPVLADSSSLPEAGGSFSVYFEHGSQAAMVEALRGLIGDPDQRLERERRIAADFKPRSWDDLAHQIDRALSQRFGEDAGDIRSGIPEVRLGSFYAFSRNTSRRLRSDIVSGYALRAGTEWHTPEDWGSWARSATVEIAGRFPAGTPIRAFLGVRGMPGTATDLTVAIDGNDVAQAHLPGSEHRWVPLHFTSGEAPCRIELRSDGVQSLAAVTNGEDSRIVGPGLLGFYACAADDVSGRLAFIEALATGVLAQGQLSAPSVLSDPAAALARYEEPQRIDAARQEKPHIEEELIAPPPPAGTRTRLEEIPLVPNETRGQIILLQSSDPEIYAPMLAQSARTTRAYAERHGYRYESFLGIKRGCLPWHASYNRIDMLMDLIRADYQGWVFYIDADAWIADMAFDLAAYLANKDRYALIAAPAGHYRDQYWNVNNGVVLFNLGHPFARAFITEWERFLSRHDLATEAKEWNVEVVDDQGMFHQILDKLPYAADLILIENKEFLNSPWASFVQHAIRAENADFEARLALVTEKVDAVITASEPQVTDRVLANAAD